MKERKIGGSYQCRICGDIHGYFLCNQKALPLQAVQISIEESEEFFASSSIMSIETRKIFEGSFKELRVLLVVPEEKIYNGKSLLDTDELEVEEIKDKTFEFNPTLEVLGRASTIISRICDFAVNNVYTTKAQGEVMMSMILSLKNEVLKK